MKKKILKVLRNTDDYISGQELCEFFGVSRTAVWKCINQLKEEGYCIDSVNKKGYKIISYPDILTESEIATRLNTRWIGKNIKSFNEIDSTNNEAKRFAENGGINGDLIVSEVQTNGKGRRGRNWISPKGTGIWFTLLLKPDIRTENVSMITLVIGMAVAKAVNSLYDLKVSIKWPNDVIVNSKKITGILTEMSTELDYINYVVVGVGINVNIENFEDEIKDKATSLKIELGHNVNRAELLAKILEIFEDYYEIFLETENLVNLKSEYNRILINVGQDVKIIQSNEEKIRKAIGINERGELLVEDENQNIEKIISGEVSVRGLYGYV